MHPPYTAKIKLISLTVRKEFTVFMTSRQNAARYWRDTVSTEKTGHINHEMFIMFSSGPICVVGG